MQTPIINILLTLLTSLVAFWVIIYWHFTTKGTWREWPAGRSLMGLLAIIAFGFGYGVVNQVFGSGGYPAKPYIGLVLYLVFVSAIIFIGITIRKEMIRGKAKAKHPTSHVPPTTGAIDITVGTDKEEAHE
jgi:uncharacterized BrkB/YihY/UPF0761 family membrane protein